MEKTLAGFAVLPYVSVCTLAVQAQTDQPTDAAPNLVFGILAIAVLAVFVLVIGYAVYKLIRKWSQT